MKFNVCILLTFTKHQSAYDTLICMLTQANFIWAQKHRQVNRMFSLNSTTFCFVSGLQFIFATSMQMKEQFKNEHIIPLTLSFFLNKIANDFS